ncbi:MAG: hypothetical protein J1F07_02055 [Muribaculaceae bacterium]|nr:hypothetical protein [Muribaculaceae bacterium]
MEKGLKSKTYIVRGLMEWEIVFPTGHALLPEVKVRFEGGQITGYGVAPARYTTDEPLIQRLIESSRWYKSGRIKLQK